jgi:hypothetical protein
MAIIYSYPKVITLNNSDLLIGSRFENGDSGEARTISFTAETLVEFVNASVAPSLDQVLTVGNESLQDAKVGSIFLYNTNVPSGLGYVYIKGDKNRFNFYNNADVNYGYIGQDTLSLVDSVVSTRQFQITKPASIGANRTATFQDASGTIAYLSDIPSTTNYGLASQIANSTPIVNTTTKSTLNGPSYVGTLSVPANGFSIGDSFNAYMMGHISNNNNVGLTITIETVAGVVLATTGLMTLAVSSNNHWVLNADFVIRATGTAGVASIITAGSFAHSKSSNNNLETYNFISENTTTFNTTIASELVIKAQWGTASASNSIYSNVFVLSKVY